MIEGSYTLGRIGHVVSKLEDIFDYLHKKDVPFPIVDTSMILEILVNSNKRLLQIYFTLGYFGVKKQLDEKVMEDLASQIFDLMMWNRNEIKDHLKIMKLLDLGELYRQQGYFDGALDSMDEVLKSDPFNRVALLAKASIYKHIGDMQQAENYRKKYDHVKANPVNNEIIHDPQEEFNHFIEKIIIGREKIDHFRSREFCSHLENNPNGFLEIAMESINFIGVNFRNHQLFNITPVLEDLKPILESLLFFFSEWLAPLSGAIYHMLKHGLGNEEQVKIVLGSLKATIRKDEAHSLESLDESFLIEYEKVRTIDKIQALEAESMNNTRIRQESYGDLRDIGFGYIDDKRLHSFHVVDFEREESRRKMFKPFEKVIKAKKITVVFGYPLSNLVRLNLENKKGFSRMDLFKAI
ncbi:MAG: tetratricopeptide repeat protein, partial [Promethearchaeota archaeon]